MLKRFKESYIGLTLITVCTFVAGGYLVLRPDLTTMFLIRLIGILYILEGVTFGCQIVIKYLEEKKINKYKKYKENARVQNLESK